MKKTHKIFSLIISILCFFSVSHAAELVSTDSGLNQIPLTLLAVLSLLAIALITVTYIGYDKPTLLAVGGILLLLLGLFVGWKGIVVQQGEKTTIDQFENFTDYDNYTKSGTNETVIKVGSKKVNGTQTMMTQYQPINEDLNTFIALGYILAGLSVFAQTGLMVLRYKE